VRDIVGGFGTDLVMDCSGHPSAGPEGIEFLRDGGTYVEMGQFTDAGSIMTSWHRICAKDINVLGSWGFTGNDLPLGVDMFTAPASNILGSICRHSILSRKTGSRGQSPMPSP